MLTDDGIYWPDEIHQSLEPAHRLVFGYGLIAWEFSDGARNWAGRPAAARSWISCPCCERSLEQRDKGGAQRPCRRARQQTQTQRGAPAHQQPARGASCLMHAGRGLSPRQ